MLLSQTLLVGILRSCKKNPFELEEPEHTIVIWTSRLTSDDIVGYTYQLGPIDICSFEVCVEEKVVETKECCTQEAESDHQKEPVLSTVKGRGTTGHAKERQEL